ncbi:MAG: CsgG/HfaB family protein [Thermoanaerobaculia bacterium]|nr:CsgG/HfaB family protein [Thermoanaerobaculia bacterium]
MKRTLVAVLSLTIGFVALMPAMASAEKPRIAVLEFKSKADNTWWYNNGAAAAQDVFVTELVKSGKFRVIEREQLAALMQEKNLSLSGDVDPSTAVRAGKLLGVDYLLTGALTEYGSSENEVSGGYRFQAKKKNFEAAMNARLIHTETGEIVWADEGRADDSSFKLKIHGVGGGVDDNKMFDKVLKPIIQELMASLKAADI